MFFTSLAFVAMLGNPWSAAAQVYPSHPITMVVPLPAGGPTDTIGRIMAEGMRASLGQPVIIENVTGASGSIGVGRVARAAPDGYTLAMGYLGTHVFNGATYVLSYDLLNDFEPVSLLVTNPLLITWEFPRLCRGGSRSLTYTAVVLRETCDGLRNDVMPAGQQGRA